MTKKQKNTSKFIQILKEYETIITAFFVLFFMLLFCFIGYYSLRVQNKSIFSSLQSENTGDLTLSSSTVTLTTQYSSMPDSIGLQYHKYGVSIENKNSKDISYELIFEINSNLQRKCGCSFPNFNYSMIHYSIDQKDVLTFIDDNMIPGITNSINELKNYDFTSISNKASCIENIKTSTSLVNIGLKDYINNYMNEITDNKINIYKN